MMLLDWNVALSLGWKPVERWPDGLFTNCNFLYDALQILCCAVLLLEADMSLFLWLYLCSFFFNNKPKMWQMFISLSIKSKVSVSSWLYMAEIWHITRSAFSFFVFFQRIHAHIFLYICVLNSVCSCLCWRGSAALWPYCPPAAEDLSSRAIQATKPPAPPSMTPSSSCTSGIPRCGCENRAHAQPPSAADTCWSPREPKEFI